MADSGSGAYQFLITEGAKEDMQHCKEQDAYAAAYLAVFLRELRSNPVYLECMVDEGFSDDKVLDIDGVWSLQNMRINAYRTKFVEIRNWRMIFIVDRKTARIGLFAVMPRSDDYEKNRELWSDIEREFDELGFTKYGDRRLPI